MSQRKVLAAALTFAALAALAVAGVDLIRNRRLDVLALTLAVGLAIGATWTYFRSVA